MATAIFIGSFPSGGSGGGSGDGSFVVSIHKQTDQTIPEILI